MFIIFAGLPGTGKSTIAQAMARRLGAVYLRIDTIEQAIRASGILPPGADVGAAGYIVAQRVAADHLRWGRIVIADSVNPIKLTRDAYRDVAEQAGVAWLEVEIVCSDKPVHRHRVETRPATVEGLEPPSWADVDGRSYEAWDRAPLQIDTATLSVAESVEVVVAAATRRS